MASIQIIRRDGEAVPSTRLTPTAKKIIAYIEQHGTPKGVFRNQDLREYIGASSSAMTEAATLGAMKPYTCVLVGHDLGVAPGERVWGKPAAIAILVKDHDGEAR